MTQAPAQPVLAHADLDIDACAREPIHIPGSIQPHGGLLVVDPESLIVLQAAIGDDDALASTANIVGRHLGQVVPGDAESWLLDLGRRVPERGVLQLGVVRGRRALHHLLVHRSGPSLIVELERAPETSSVSPDDVFPSVREFLEGIRACTSVTELANLAAREVRRITGLDRALVYQFDEDWNGAVIAEDRNERLPEYLDLRFPASDIPAQARELYRLNRLRLIASAQYEPARLEPELHPVTGAPTDLSFSVLRSVSPVHLEYMRNMGTMASMSISLMRGDKLWGLISCHHRDPFLVGYPVRTACDLIGQVLSMQITALEGAAFAERRSELQGIQARLLAHMAGAASAEGTFVDGLVANEADLLALTGASGAAVVAGEQCTLLGATPSQDQVSSLVAWLATGQRGDIFVTDHLASVMPGGEALKDAASGVLAISISQLHASYVIWFRPEVIQTITWGGDPHKRAEVDPSGLRLHPRRSFEAWQETVRLRSQGWAEAEIAAAGGLRTAIVDIVLRQAEEMAAISDKLVTINKELEAFSYSVSHDLRAPFRHIVGYAQLLKKFEGAQLSERGNRFIDTIIESAISAGTLVDDLLSFSQMGRSTLTPVPIDMDQVVQEVRRTLQVEGSEAPIDWRIAPLPTVRADPIMIRLALQNLLENAIKFTRHRDTPLIEIGVEETETDYVFFVRDNGTGFDMAYVGKLFGVFQRLHRVEEFEGTGIGLANVKRIVERHGGRVWAEGKVDGGATFSFSLPKGRG